MELSARRLHLTELGDALLTFVERFMVTASAAVRSLGVLHRGLDLAFLVRLWALRACRRSGLTWRRRIRAWVQVPESG